VVKNCVAKNKPGKIGLGSKKVDISITSLFLHEKLDTMILFLHITDPALSAGSDKTKIKPSSTIVKKIQAGSQCIREQGTRIS
jgi:hypothetical protein